jgi:GNAT superfamily N-acetyltransferase
MLPWKLGLSGACRRCTLVDAVGQYSVRTALRTGEATSPWPGVLVDGARATEPLTMISAAWLATGEGSVVTGPTAAFLHRCSAASPTPVHLAVPYETRRRTRPGVVVHNGMALVGDRVTIAGLPVLALERTIADLLCTLRPAEALAITDQAMALEDVDAEEFRLDVRERLLARPDPRGTRVGTRLLELATGLARSPAESRLLWTVADLGYPVPRLNHPLRGVWGEELYLIDLAWPEVRIALEYDGYETHVGREVEDELRAHDLRSRGWIVVRVDKSDLVLPLRLAAELDEAFRRRGIDMSRRVSGGLRPRRHREAG